MPWFLHCVLFAWCLHLLMLGCSWSEQVLPPPSSNGSSQEHILPTPLILHLNQSAAEQLIQEANSMFVSNTSLSDLINDNATQQMLLRYRERKRQVRLMSIQRDILHKLGLTKSPNVTARLSAEERQSLVLSFDRTMIERTNSSENNVTAPCAEEANDPC